MARKLGPPLRAVASRVRAEDGFGLIEVLVTAVLVALVGIGVFTGLDAASATSGLNKQERLRSFRVGELSNLDETRTVTSGGVPYTVNSRATWVSDGSGSQSCTNTSNDASYLRIKSTVSWPSMGGTSPVQLTSLVAPPNGSFGANEGSLVVQVRDGTGAGIEGVSVTATGPATLSDTTDESGCAFFGYVAPGTYTVSPSQTGYVDPSGAAAPSRQASVIGEETATVAFDYAQAGSATVSFDTSVGGTVRAATAENVILAHSGLPAPGRRTFGTGSSRASIAATSLFPFSSPYAVYSGNCSGADPRNYSQAAGLLTVAPGGAYTITVREPAINILVRKDGVALNAARVRVTRRSTGCSGALTRSTNATGALPEPGFPYGNYDVCADDALGASARRVTRTGIVNTNPLGTAVLTFDILSSNPVTGACP